MWFPLFAASDGHFSLLSLVGIPSSLFHVAMAAFVTLLLSLLARATYISYKAAKDPLIPDSEFTFRNVLEVIIEQLLGLFQGILGKDAPRYLPLLGTIFLYIFISNMMGLIPGFLPPTDNLNTNLPIAFIVFAYYNYYGVKEHGLKNYLKHFMGPIWWLAWLMIPIEIISHLFRPISLSLRLFGNINGDHLVLGQFSEMTPYFIPIIFIGLGLFVSFMQAFVFSFLSAIYINLANSHDH